MRFYLRNGQEISYCEMCYGPLQNTDGKTLCSKCMKWYTEPMPPLVKGGQGHDAEGLTFSAWVMVILIGSVICALIGVGIGAAIHYFFP